MPVIDEPDTFPSPPPSSAPFPESGNQESEGAWRLVYLARGASIRLRRVPSPPPLPSRPIWEDDQSLINELADAMDVSPPLEFVNRELSDKELTAAVLADSPLPMAPRSSPAPPTTTLPVPYRPRPPQTPSPPPPPATTDIILVTTTETQRTLGGRE